MIVQQPARSAIRLMAPANLYTKASPDVATGNKIYARLIASARKPHKSGLCRHVGDKKSYPGTLRQPAIPIKKAAVTAAFLI
ncbi:hypothetical protein EGT74_20895 [Chitinophaga lutea]|uniref:Uncharacterized protein n=1 Tax=Chitinophaga lutea TaxID=2488634 RepID=A0A3N4PNS9_9BACT|nr:hypothetical protein EGT74_20895 [Chitinophaga lutea]